MAPYLSSDPGSASPPNDLLTPLTPFTDSDDCLVSLSLNDQQWTFTAKPAEADSIKSHFDVFASSSSDSSPSTSLDLASDFLSHLGEHQCPPQSVVRAVLGNYERSFLLDRESPPLAAELSAKARSSFLKSYLTSVDCSSPSSEDLSSSPRYRGYAIFGGQGPSNGACLKDLRALYLADPPMLDEFLRFASGHLSLLTSAASHTDFFEKYGFDLSTWLDDPDSAPTPEHISLAPYSVPIIGTLSLAQFIVTCKKLGKTPGELLSSFQGIAGHSQGVVLAAFVARADDWASFFDSARMAIETLFHVGLECHLCAQFPMPPATFIQESLHNDEGIPSPMLSVRGLDRPTVEALVKRMNENAHRSSMLKLALINSADNFVVAGPPRRLCALNAHLRKLKVQEGVDQSRIVFNKRAPQIRHTFMPISAPFHTSHTSVAIPRILKALECHSLCGSDLKVAVYDTLTGKDLRLKGKGDVKESLIQLVANDLVDWPATTIFPSATHVVDFGPGGLGALSYRAMLGTSTRVMKAADLYSLASIDNNSIFEVQNSRPSVCWNSNFRPRIGHSTRIGSHVETKMTRLLGLPPVMVAGMTPTTVHWDVVASIMRAGYYAEFALGGHHRVSALEESIRKLAQHTPPGHGITCNIIYASPKQVSWQVPLIRKLVGEGLPIDGLTIGAGVPSPPVVEEYITTLGLKHISFKPGSVDAIKQVIAIAKAHVSFPIGLQWTGGRGGGHHSYEDFHSPMLEMYGEIRKCSNIFLVAGSGFGGAVDSYPYLTGAWSATYDKPPMPFDGILVASRMMVAKESHTSPAAKQLIVEAPGVGDKQWSDSYTKPTGGIITVISEMGQPIHKIANRGVLLWKMLDDTIFSIRDRAKRLETLLSMKSKVIKRLDEDYQKPWFAHDETGQACDVEDMTYSSIISRLVELMYVSHQQRWVDATYRTIIADFATRASERMGCNIAYTTTDVNDPGTFTASFNEKHPLANDEILHMEDVSYFLGLCKRRGQKPVNFIPCLDESFETWFKKDSLWQSEDVDAVIGQDAQRVCILHGPVAASHSRSMDLSSGQILDEIQSGLLNMLKADGSFSNTEIVSLPSQPGSLLDQYVVQNSGASKTYRFPPNVDLPNIDDFFQAALADSKGMPWVKAALETVTVTRDCKREHNPIRSALHPSRGHSFTINFDPQRTIKNLIVSTRRSQGAGSLDVVEVSPLDDDGLLLCLRQEASTKEGQAELNFRFRYEVTRSVSQLFDVTEERNHEIKRFYAGLWLGEYSNDVLDAAVDTNFAGRPIRIDQAMVDAFVRAVKPAGFSQSFSSAPEDNVPLDMSIMIAWEALVQPLLTDAIDGDLLRLLHVSNSCAYRDESAPLHVGNMLTSKSHVSAVTISPSGKFVEVIGEIERDGKVIVDLKSVFLFRGIFTDFESSFRTTKEPSVTFGHVSESDEALLKSRDWLALTDNDVPLVGQRLSFDLTSKTGFDSRGNLKGLSVTGAMTNKQGTVLGQVTFDSDIGQSNPIMDFLLRRGRREDSPARLENHGWQGEKSWSVEMPRHNARYSAASKDCNPIHTSAVFANLVGLPDVVTHGMLSSAVVRNTIEQIIVDGRRIRFREFEAKFLDMVFPGDRVRIDVEHVAMHNGKLVFDVTATNEKTGSKVLEAQAEIEQEQSAYVFTGQGSQEKHMGMSLYQSSAAAREIWDRADRHLYELYGFSILEIVRNDPKSLTIYFGGQRGRALRKNFMALKAQKILPDGSRVEEQLIEGITATSRSHTFSDARGLLYSTQFAQPALTILETASYADLKAKGLVQSGAPFAGHSLGEYSALGAVAEVTSLEGLASLVFYRGLRMQVAIERDASGRTEFSMIAVNPSRVDKAFTPERFFETVEAVSSATGVLLEVVNHNVYGRQYVCAGHLQALWTLSRVLDAIAASHDTSAAGIAELAAEHAGTAAHLSAPINLERGTATVPLRGIDVPFHSKALRDGIAPYRAYLNQQIRAEDIDVERLVGRWIPNVTGAPFDVSREYVAQAAQVMDSAVLRDVVDKWQDWHGSTAQAVSA